MQFQNHEDGSAELTVYAVAKPSAYLISEKEAKKIQSETPDIAKFKEIMKSAEQFEHFCLQKK